MTSALSVRLAVGASLAAKLLAPPTIVAARPATSVRSSAVVAGDSVVFKHKGCGPPGSECRVAYALSLDDGEQFKVRIDSTIIDEFTYDIAGIVLASASTGNLNAIKYATKELTQKHDKKYGGYIVSIRRKGATSSLNEATLMISVRTREWISAFAGGFPVSTITDKVFGLRDSNIVTPAATVGGQPTTTTKHLVEREKSQEDRVSLATATFIHLSHTAHPNVGLSFGLGIGGNTTYYLGPSWMFGDRGALTAGVALGSRKELPSGVREGDLTANANAVASLPNRNTLGGFLSFSFSFLSGGASAFEKPFKGSDTQTGGGGGKGGGAGDAAGGPASTANTTLTPTPKTAKAGSDIDFTLTIGPAPDGKSFTSGNFQITVSSGPFTIAKGGVTLDPIEDGKRAQGTFTAKLKADAAGPATLEVRVVGQGFDGKITGQPVTVTP